MSITPPRDEASVAVRQRLYVDAKRAAVWGLGVNFFLVLSKLAGGIATGSAALIADAVNSIGDVASSMAVRGALSMAQVEEDEDHPYGHTKAESIAGLSVSLLVAFSAGLLGLETIKRFGGDLEVPSSAAGVIAGACAVIKEIIYRYTMRVAKRLDSSSLTAVAWDHRSDAIGSGLIAVSLIAAPYVGDWGQYIDPVAALCLCVALIYTGGKIFLSTAAELMDQQADAETLQQIREIAESVGGVRAVEKLRARKSGLEYFIEIHVQVEGLMTVDAGHRIAHHVKDELLVSLPRVRDVHVHIEPFSCSYEPAAEQ
ncbi:cation diffusion facilitator family transporter [bacterium]|nr:cation diffusion facilitator family transporter [Rubripirellula sp.]MDA7904967.1 cation diffusion facilitator family transporter [Rhodopirellula sp.]MDB4353369.1 cation diffusion facilitator family transporter [bacterium]MDB4416492.1 cation diffusion facilitator family transporter [bacterium]MDB4532956.1 cation diffusion facilitator family transporter [bacterium]MDB4557547.1 cation diffusion facilitator family transporter [bacterium]